jgi:hypothetical protein
MGSSRTQDVGRQLIDLVQSFLEQRGISCRVRDAELSWWAAGFRQRIWCQPFNDDGYTVFRISAATDYLRGVAVTDANLAKFVALSSFATVFAVVVDPRDSSVKLCSSVYVGTDDAEALVSTLVESAFAQVTVAVSAVDEATAIFGGKPDRSASSVRELAKDRENFAALISGVQDSWRRGAVNPSTWLGCDEFQQMKSFWSGRQAFASADETGLTTEFPFAEGREHEVPFSALGARISLLHLQTDVVNPQHGNGLFVRFSLPLGLPEALWTKLSIALNLLETREFTCAHLLGNWSREESFVSFVPNALHCAGLVRQLSMGGAKRSLWVESKFNGGNDERSAARIIAAVFPSQGRFWSR